MARLMDIGLSRLTNLVLDMAQLSEKSVNTSIEAYRKGKSIVEEIYQWSEELRALDEEVGELATELIARFQPVASDLRFIKASMEISNDLSRFGRYAYDIAEVLQMFGDLSDCDQSLVGETAATTRQMIRMSIEAFAKRDVDLAKKIKSMDDIVDNNYREYISRSINDSRSNLKCIISTTLVLRYLERIADHSYYIGDSVIFIVTGERAKPLRNLVLSEQGAFSGLT